MPVKLRLQRFGKKGKPYYQIVAADIRSKRDGKYIERIGNYNPNTNPATINLNFERAVYWIENGAQPTDTCRAILKYRGVMMRHHLNRGVLKGALTQEQADAKFDKWLSEKDAIVQSKRDKLAKAKDEARRTMLKAETEVKEKRAADLAAKSAELAKEAEAARAAAEAAAAPAVEEVLVEETATESPAAEAKEEAPADEVKEEAPAAEAKEEPKAE